MKRLFIIALAILFFAGMVYAHNIVVEPKAGGPYTQVMPVYSASALDVGDVVVWAVKDSTGDDDPWVATTTAVDTVIVAGVVYPSAIGAGGTGFIATYGIVDCDIHANGVGAGSPLCTSGTAGSAAHCVDEDHNFGHATSGSTSSSAKCFVNP